MAIDTDAFRTALGCYPTGVAVVTARGPAGERVGMTANSFTSVSLDPPLVSFCLDRASVWFEVFRAAGHFAVNVLREGDEEISRRFALLEAASWDDLATTTWRTGCPILEDALAALECRVRDRHAAGDHVILVGEVLAFSAASDGAPLAFFRGGYRRLAELN
jgi:flavin reductase (DIM6/NTAB) family NADH-FMN oxidoreductase RutF